MNYDQVTKEAKDEFWNMIDVANNILITSHMSPDDDSISSTLGLFTSIKLVHPEKKVRVVYSGKPDQRYAVFENFDRIVFVNDVADELEETDLMIILDAGQWSRASKKPDLFARIKSTICVDHHVSPPDEFTLRIIDTNSPDCAELLYLLCEQVKIHKSLAETFLLGILGDTGNFSYLKPHQTRTLDIGKKLIEIGQVEIQDFQSRYRFIGENVLVIMKELMKNLQNGEVNGRKPFSYSFISRDFVERHQFTNEEIVSAKNIFVSSYIRTVEGHPWGFTIIPKPDGTCGISTRAMSQTENVRLILEGLNLGGGHDLAAGGTFKDIAEPEEAIKKFLEMLNSSTPNGLLRRHDFDKIK